MAHREIELWIIISWFLEKQGVGYTGIKWFNVHLKDARRGVYMNIAMFYSVP
jgi:hypothetical protein